MQECGQWELSVSKFKWDVFSPAAPLCYCSPISHTIADTLISLCLQGTPKGPAPKTLSFPSCLLSTSLWMNGPCCLVQMPPRVLRSVFHCSGNSPSKPQGDSQSPGSLLNFPNNPSADEGFQACQQFPYIESQLGNYPWPLMFLYISTWGRCIWRTYQHPSRNLVGQEMEV